MKVITPPDLIRSAEEIIEVYRVLTPDLSPEKKGGYLTVGLDCMTSTFVSPVGTYDPAKEEKYKELSGEKADRLYANWARDHSSVSSYQSKNPSVGKYGQWGGSVLFARRAPSVIKHGTRLTCDIVSFSGLPELGDEAVSFVLGFRLELGSGNYDELAKQIIGVSGNPSLRDLFNAFKS